MNLKIITNQRITSQTTRTTKDDDYGDTKSKKDNDNGDTKSKKDNDDDDRKSKKIFYKII